MDRLDGKGYKPWIRPHIPHRKKERSKLKVTKSAFPKWKLAMMKLGMNFIAEEDGRIKLCRLTESDILETSETTMKEQAVCLDMSCGEVGNYAMLEAAPSRPPPKHGWAHKVIQYAAVLFLAALAALATACKKEPQPEPWREAVIPWMWGGGMGLVPPKDTVAFYANDPTVKYVYIHILQADTYGSAWEPRHFKKARDSLQSRIDIAPDKVRGRGTIKVGRNGAHIHPDTLTEKFGMWETDSLWFARNGWRVERMFPRRLY